MNITYKYEIQELRCEPSIGELNKVITEVVYEYVAESDNGITSRLPGMVKLAEPVDQSFVPVDEISKDTVVSWIESIADIELAKKMVDDEIKYKSGFIYNGNSLPWNLNNM